MADGKIVSGRCCSSRLKATPPSHSRCCARAGNDCDMDSSPEQLRVRCTALPARRTGCAQALPCLQPPREAVSVVRYIPDTRGVFLPCVPDSASGGEPAV